MRRNATFALGLCFVVMIAVQFTCGSIAQAAEQPAPSQYVVAVSGMT
jgi:hypothetical protein